MGGRITLLASPQFGRANAQHIHYEVWIAREFGPALQTWGGFRRIFSVGIGSDETLAAFKKPLNSIADISIPIGGLPEDIEAETPSKGADIRADKIGEILETLLL